MIIPKLDCKRVLITGGTSGLGLAMAQALSKAGAQVALTSRKAERAAATAKLIPGSIGIEMDSTEELSVIKGIDEIYSRLGGIDMLINNAGLGMITVNPKFMSEPIGFWEVTTDKFKRLIDTNLTGYFIVAKHITKRMLESGGGRIVNISMNHSTMNRKGFIPYGPSRAGAEALTRILAADLSGTDIKVNILLPGGATKTGMLPVNERSLPELNLLSPSIMGEPIVWLASDQARNIHNERIIANEFHDWLAQK
jgi:gluconate 5-dehydrogenase